MLIKRTKYELIIKLIAQRLILRDESIMFIVTPRCQIMDKLGLIDSPLELVFICTISFVISLCLLL
jgi:hypothetical protein